MKYCSSVRNLPLLVLAAVLTLQCAWADPLPNAWQITDNATANGSAINYTTNLPPAWQKAATNLTGGFHLTVNARFVTNFAGTKTMAMAYGTGPKRFLIWFNLNGDGDLTAELEGSPVIQLTGGGSGTMLYHTHEIVYNASNASASYLFDGNELVSGWPGSGNSLSSGQVFWGAGSSPGLGQMNFHSVSFQITNITVASYDAGTNDNPVTAPDPETLSWKISTNNPPPNSYATDVSPDTFNLNFYQLPDPGLPGVWFSAVAWGDFDNDGKPDFLLTGKTNISAPFVSQLWRNTGSGFTNVTATVAPNLPGAGNGSVAWEDYDRDGQLDFLLTGSVPSQLWRNTGTGFTNVTALVAPGLPRVSFSSVAWGDYDNDGRPDFLLTGVVDTSSTGRVAQVWRNTGSGFTNVTDTVAPGLPGVYYSSAAWADYDNDGTLDFLLTGISNPGTNVSQLWRNTGSGFSNVTTAAAPGLPQVSQGSVAWGDYDNDGWLDFLLTGSGKSQLWRNTGSGFTNVTTEIAPGLPGLSSASVAWGDYDNDGKLDFFLIGVSNVSASISQLWQNTGSNFIKAPIGDLPGAGYGSVSWADYNDDGRLDLLLTGTTNLSSSGLVSQLWRNYVVATNHAPAWPKLLPSSLTQGVTQLSWYPGKDFQSPTRLSYNIRVGSAPGLGDVVSPLALTNGLRLLPGLGNAQMRTNAILNLPPGTYYWSVQSIDTAFAGGWFAPEDSFVVPPPISIIQTNGDAMLSWSPNMPGFMLQETLSLWPANWTNSPSGATNPVVVPATDSTKFFRLIKIPPS